MEDLLKVVIVVLGLLAILFLRSVGATITLRLRKRRGHLTQARRHFVKAASMLGQARSGKLTTSERRSLAGSAITEADLALELDPQDAATLIVKSLALEILGKTAAALKVLDVALSKDLAKSLTGQERGDTLTKSAELKLGLAKGKRDARIQSALANMQEAVTLVPSSARTHLVLGSCYERCGDKDEALLAFQQTLVLDPSNADAKSAVERLQGGGTRGPPIAVTV